MSDMGMEADRKIRFLRAFSEHPASVNETYFQHLRFAIGFSGKLLVASLAALVHALIPAWFETTASRTVKSMAEAMENRHK